MDRKSIIILAVAILVLLALSPVIDHFFPPKQVPISALHPTNALATSAGGQPLPSPAPGPAPGGPAAPTAVMPAGPEKTITVTNDDLVFVFTSHGGGLKTVALKEYPAVIKRRRDANEINRATLNLGAPLPILALLGPDAQGDNNFILTQQGQTVTAEITLSNGLRLVKEFAVGTNYLFTAKVRYENPTARAAEIPARQLVIGTATPIGPLDDPTAVGTFWYNGVKAQNIKQPWFANRTLGCLPGTPRSEYEDGSNNVVWAAVHNQFFTLAAIPNGPAPGIAIHPVWIPVPEMDGYTNASSAFLTNGFQAAFIYPAASLPPRQSLEGDFTFYAGPKEYNRLAQIGLRMNNNLDLIMDFSGFTGFFSKLLLLSLNGLHAVAPAVSYGWAIIAITLIIKLIFWPLTRASTKSQKRMQALQPQLKAIADKYKDDPVKKNQKTMDFMKEHKISPLGSCLPMVIQIPVFIGFYWMLRNAIELRGVRFLWAADLSQPDTIGHLMGFPVNPLPLIMGATQLWQQLLLPPSPGMDPGQQKVMKFMPLLFVGMFYKMSAGLTLYWTVSNFLSILQTKVTKMTGEDAAKVPAAAAKKKV